MLKKKLPRNKLIKKLDTVISVYIRLRDSDEHGYLQCISCDKRIYYKDAHCCHRISRGCLRFRFDEDNLAGGCAGCNTYRPEYHLRMFTIKMIQRFGQEKVDEMIAQEKEVYKIPTWRMEEMIDEYKAKTVDLLSKKKI